MMAASLLIRTLLRALLWRRMFLAMFLALLLDIMGMATDIGMGSGLQSGNYGVKVASLAINPPQSLIALNTTTP